MTFARSLAVTVALLTAVQVIIHVREYGLLLWPRSRTAQHVGRPRLTAIVRWEAAYYLLLCSWVGMSWLAWDTLPPTWIASAIFVFSASHIFGAWSLRTQLVQLAAAAGRVDRDSSVAELATMITTEQGASYPVIVGSIVTFDGIELLMLGWVLFYSVSIAALWS